jgi:hypothetical protein
MVTRLEHEDNETMRPYDVLVKPPVKEGVERVAVPGRYAKE